MDFGKWKRGFPIRLDAPAHDLLAEWGRVLCLVPVTELDIWQARDADMEELAAACDLRNLRELFVQSEISNENESLLTDRALVALAECPAVTGLECLVVRWAGLTDRGIDAVLRSPYLTNLRELQVYDGRRGRAGKRRLPYLTNLRELQVYRDRNFEATYDACEGVRARFGSKAIR